MQPIKLGTRGSRLALWQARYTADSIQLACPTARVETVIIKTRGDKILDTALSRIGGKGLFTSEIESELLDGKIDLAVHSLKDLPSQLSAGLCLAAYLKREDYRDVLLSSQGYKLASLPPGAVLGTSSLRRIAQLKSARPDLKTVDLRGNVETRIHKMQELGLDGIILACAGVKRLGFEGYITDYLSSDIILPAVGQGIIAVETREDDSSIREILNQINDAEAHWQANAERAFLKQLQGGCQVPIGALATVQDDDIILDGLVSSLDGKTIIRGQEKGSLNKAASIGVILAKRLLDQGADTILAEIERLGE
ncbi:MAG TPA: hydroxymethylbilane synthase [Syntrophomonadaceae bacterium]|nr:hydroxymethylbilane synthase [Syntrophomonadaceae bacterium]